MLKTSDIFILGLLIASFYVLTIIHIDKKIPDTQKYKVFYEYNVLHHKFTGDTTFNNPTDTVPVDTVYQLIK